jgi:hypothetical protein
MREHDQRMRYLNSARRQLQRDLDEMGYGQRSQPAVERQATLPNVTGYIMAFATVAVLFLSLSLSGLL